MIWEKVFKLKTPILYKSKLNKENVEFLCTYFVFNPEY